MGDYTDEPQTSKSDSRSSGTVNGDSRSSGTVNGDPSLRDSIKRISLPNNRAKFEPLRIREVENFKFPYTITQVGIAIFITLIIVVIISRNLKD